MVQDKLSLRLRRTLSALCLALALLIPGPGLPQFGQAWPGWERCQASRFAKLASSQAALAANPVRAGAGATAGSRGAISTGAMSGSPRANSPAARLSGTRATISNGNLGLNSPIEDKWAVVIGISDFIDPSVPHLKYASKDARDFYDYLIDPNGGKFSRDHVKLLLNSDASKVNILDTLGDSFLPHAADSNDLVLVYLSTHGSPSGADLDGINYLIAYDTQVRKLFATGIELNEIVQKIKKRVHTKRIVLVLDTCYSGAGAQGHKGMYRTNANVQAVSQGIGSVVISSSTANQKAWESDDLRNSYFTRYLIDTLKEGGGTYDIDKVFSTMRSKVQSSVLKDKGEVQTPIMAGIFAGPPLNLAVPPSVTREAPLTVPTSEGPAKATAGSKVGTGAIDLTAYGEHIRLGNKLAQENKVWDAIHEFELAGKANPGTVEGYIVLSRLYDSQGRFNEMLDNARRAVVNDKESSQGREALAMANLRLNNTDEAMRQVQLAISLDPFNSMAHNLYGYINEFKFNRVDQAEKEYRKALELNPLNTRALVNLGRLLEVHHQNFDEAESLFKKAIASDDDDFEARTALGHLLYSARNNYKEAEKEFRKAIEHSPANPRLHSELGHVLSADKTRVEEAEVELKKGIELGSGQSAAVPNYLMANFLWHKRGRIQEAERDYRKALEADPQYFEAMVALADLLVQHKNVYNESNDLYLKALKISPKNAEAHLGLAVIKERLFKDYGAAETELRAALAINPKYSQAADALGQLQERALGKFSDARISYRDAVKMDPNNADAWLHLGLINWQKFQESKTARTELEKAAGMETGKSVYRTALATLLITEFKDYKEAEKLLTQSCQQNFADSEAHYRLGMLLIEKFGKRKAGEAELKIAYEQNPRDKDIKAAYERFVR
ncbi:MAG: tetratricopeptide repeat protein [Candidatus Obscuribacter sp.]|nr:tetratricopeptide repeat protein [Candidatus Melainabacteria bacterium]MDX1989965.1 tetratricopeptide repeat protein [Candidatus Obscuribacter sp.]